VATMQEREARLASGDARERDGDASDSSAREGGESGEQQ
jgi:hypothetical protein